MKLVYIKENKRKIDNKNKNKNKLKYFNIISLNRNNRNIALLIGLIQLIFFINLSKENENENEISTVNMKGKQRLFYKTNNLDSVFINDRIQNFIGDEVELVKEENKVKLTFLEVDSCDYMFALCDYIVKIDLSKFNSSKVTNMKYMFSNSTRLQTINFTNFDASLVQDMEGLFFNCYSLTTIIFEGFDTKSLLTMNKMFGFCESLEVIDLSSFNTSLVTDMSYMFFKCDSLKSININNFNTVSVTNTSYMFAYCFSLQSLNLDNFNTISARDMEAMFWYCISLQSLNVNNFDTSLVTTMEGMFSNCTNLTSLDLSSFDTSSVNNMNHMFSESHKLQLIEFGNNFKTFNVINMGAMFYNCFSLTSLNLSKFDTSAVKDMNHMFSRCQELTSLDLSNFDTLLVEKMNHMFANCQRLTSLDLSSFDTSSVTNMSCMFLKCPNLITIKFGNNFKTNRVSNMSSMFCDCFSLTSLDLSSFDTLYVEDMDHMFSGCQELSLLNLSSFDTSSVTNMNSMFLECRNVRTITFGNNFKTSNVDNMGNMFYNCTRLRSLDLSTFDTSSVTVMNNMFTYCATLKSLDLNNFITSSVKDMYGMFYLCGNLISLEINNFDTKNVLNMSGLFNNCKKLQSLNLYNFDTQKLQKGGSIFSNVQNLIYCINFTKTSKIKNQLEKDNFIYNCSYFCFKESKKYIEVKEQCIDSCNEDNIYRYEYNSYCYDSCPSNLYYNYEKTGCIDKIPLGYYLKNEIEKTIDKCIDNCTNCTKDSLLDNSCISCNNSNGYYQLINDNQNDPSFKKCYNETPEGYFFDNNENLVKPCYSKCKKCNQFGDENINNCTECYINNKLINGNCYIECQYYFYYNSSNSYQCTTEEKCPDEYNKLIEEENQCIDNCEKTNNYKYEFNGKCYRNCPNTTYISQNNNYLCEEGLVCNNYYNYNHTGCLDVIPEGYYLNDTYHKTIDKCNIKCKKCSIDSVSHNLCISCNNNNNYYPKFNDSLNNNSFINCYNGDLVGFYFDDNNHIYMPCYPTCQKCNDIGDTIDNKCIDCYSNSIKINNNCYHKCSFYFFFDFSDIYQCTLYNYCPTEYNKLIREKSQCIDYCYKDDTYKYEYNNICYIQCPNEAKITGNYTCIEKIQCNYNYPYIIIENGECSRNCSAINFFKYICTIDSDDPRVKDEMINTIRTEILNGNMDELINSNVSELNRDLTVLNKKLLYQITSSYNQNNNNKNVNISTIKLGECENILKRYYHLNDDEDLIIFKIEVKVEGFLIPIIEYEVYSLNIREKLNLKLCNQTKINIIHTVSIYENYIFKYNSTDDFYTDKCYPFTTESNTDITLDDRKNEFIDKNMSLCEANCEYKGYDSNTKQAECNCEFKTSISLMDKFEINENLLLNNFKEIEKSMNLFVLKCYYVLFTCDGLLSNIGSYISLVIILIEILCLIFFLLKGYQFLMNRFHHFYLMLNYNEKDRNKNKIEKNKIGKFDNTKISSDDEKLKKEEKKSNNQNINVHRNSNIGNIYNESVQKIYSNNILRKKQLISNPKKKKIKLVKRKKKIKIKGHETESRNLKDKILFSSHIRMNKYSNKQLDELSNYSKESVIKAHINNYNDYELNNLIYEEALEYDKRTYCQYYIAQLKYKQLLIFTFYTNIDYNSKIIKISLFFFFFELYFTVNALFFSDSTMHKIYVDKGAFNFIYQIPQILYSSIISSVIHFIINFLSLSEKSIVKLREEKKEQKNEFETILKCLKIKFILLFILEFLFLVFFWYYLGCFCAVYRNTQSHLLKDTLTSFGLSMIYPFGMTLIPGTLRIPALIDKNQKCLYKISQILQLIF